MKKITKAVIPAAGYGTRFLPFTKIMPKEMLPIVDTPTIELIVREAISSGITDVLIIINRDKDIIKTHFGHNNNLEKFLEKKNKTNELEIIKELPNLAFCQAHATVILPEVDMGVFKKLKIDVTTEAEFYAKKLYK